MFLRLSRVARAAMPVQVGSRQLECWGHTLGEDQKRGEPGNFGCRSNEQPLHLAALFQLWPVLEVAVCCPCSSRCGILNVLTF